MLTCFIDFQKAFDVVPRKLLYHRLLELKVNGPFLKLICEMNRNTTNQIRLNGLLTEQFGSDIGLRQGDNLSPNLFSCYINDLLSNLGKNGPKFHAVR